MQILKSLPGLIYSNFSGSFTMFKNYIKIAIRNIWKFKGCSLIKILGLTVGMAVFIMIGLFIQFEMSFDRYHKNADRIYRVANERWDEPQGHFKEVGTPGPLAPTLADEFPEVEAGGRIWRWHSGYVNLTSEKITINEELYYVSKEIFNIFSIPFVKGSSELSMKGPFSIIISERLVDKYFRNEDPIGKVFSYNGSDFTITGIIKNMPVNSHFIMDLITPFSTFVRFNGDWINQWNGGGSHAYILLREGADAEELEKKLPAILEKYRYNNSGNNVKNKDKLFLQPLTSIHLHSSLNNEYWGDNYNIKYIYIFSAVGIIILLLACINYTNISIAQLLTRSREAGLRRVVGADKSQIVVQFLSESIIISILALILAVFLVIFIAPIVNNIIGRQLNFNIQENPLLLPFLGGLTILLILTGILAGIYPALLISSVKPVQVLKGIFYKKSKGSLPKNILISFQFSISIFAIICTVTVMNQLRFIKNKDIGYNKEQIVVINSKGYSRFIQNRHSIKSELLRNPGILAVSYSSNLPNYIHRRGRSDFPEKAGEKPIEFCTNSIDHDFLNVFGMKIIEGRNFSREFSSDVGGILINEAAAKVCKWDSPVGKEFNYWGSGRGKIIGKMKDFHMRSLHYPIEPVFFILSPVNSGPYISIKISAENIPDSIEHIRNTLKTFAPGFPFEYDFYDEVFDRDYKNELIVSKYFNGFALSTVLIACVGLFGLASFTMQKRTKEIGIRKALGATVTNISLLLSREFSYWITIGNLLAWPAAYYFMNKWLHNFAYRMNVQLWIFILSGLSALTLAIITISYHTIKAAHANPVESLRDE